MSKKKSKEEITDGLTEYAGNAAGCLAGAAVGAAIAGPQGALLGSVASTALERIFQKAGNEIKKRALAPLEEQRVGAVYDKAKSIIEQKRQQGEHPRNDNFFDSDDSGRSAGEELLEGTLLAAQREYEEKKEAYLARLYANILFHQEISRPMANHLIKLAEQLTYRQIVILGIVGLFHQIQQETPALKLLKQNAYESVSGMENVAIAAEIFDMYRMSILGSSQVILDSAGINPSTLNIVGYGANLYNLMELNQLEPDSELLKLQPQIISFLTGKPIIEENAE